MQLKIGLSDEAIKILSLPQEERTDELVRLAVAALIIAVPEYGDYTPNIQRSIAKVCQYDKYESGRVILRQGHKADNYYFIVSGISKLYLNFDYLTDDVLFSGRDKI